MILVRSSRLSVVGLGVFLMSVAFLMALAVAVARTAEAHEDVAQHGGIQLTPEAPEWTDDGEYLKFHLSVADEHSKEVSRPGGELAWSYKWFSYEHVEGGEFGCADRFFGIERSSRLEEWLEDNGYDDTVYETQKNIFATNGNFIFVRVQDDGSYRDSFTLLKEKSGPLAGYAGGEGKLAICFKVEYDDGSHASLSRIVVDFSDLASSQIETNLSQNGEGSPTGGASGSGTQPDTTAGGGTGGQSIGGTGGGPNREDLPETGLTDDSDGSLLLAVGVSSAVIVALALLSILYRAKRHHQRKS